MHARVREVQEGSPAVLGGLPHVCAPVQPLLPLLLLGVDTDELDSNVDDWEEETIEFFVTEEIIPLGNQE